MKHNPGSHCVAARCDRNRSSFAAIAALFVVTAGSILPLNAKSHTAPSPDKLPGLGLQPVEYFYTGKPYDADTETYTFKYRNYDPELNRWTTADPSGFPDGANNQVYAPNPFSEFDPLGLRTSLGKPSLPSPSGWSYGDYELVEGNLYKRTRAQWEYTGWAYTGIEGVGNIGEGVTFGVSATLTGSGSVSVGLSGGVSGVFSASTTFSASGGIGAGGSISESKPAVDGVSWEAKGLIGTGRIDVQGAFFELVNGQYQLASGYSGYSHSSYSWTGTYKLGLGIEWFE